MTKPSVPTPKAAGLGHPPKAGNTKAVPPSAQRLQANQKSRAKPDGKRRVPADEAVTVPRVPFTHQEKS